MRLLRKLYDWVLHWAETPYGAPALFLVAFSESSFLPIPPDVLLIALGLALPRKVFRYALICTAGSVLGGAFGYLLGWQFWELAKDILFHYVSPEGFDAVRKYFIRYQAWAVAIAGFTPIPYKVFTLTAGFLRADFRIFLLASTLSRAARFFLVALLIYKFGPSVRIFIEKYFNILTVLFAVLLIGGFILLKYAL